jgi:hypothetical protein
VEWHDATGALLGTMPVSLKGSVLAGDTKVFSTAAGTLATGGVEGKGAHATIKWTHVAVPEK